MMDIIFLITTYNRPTSCQRLVDSLQGLGDIIVLGDGVDYVIERCAFYNLPRHNGKMLYWMTVRQLFSLRGKHKYYVMLPDDWIPIDGAISRSVELWEQITDPKKICLNILCPGTVGLINWTGFPAKDVGNVLKTQWVDGCFICEDLFFISLGVLPPTIRPHRSSGVGAYISKKLNKRGFGLYMVKETLFVAQEEHSVSQMHKNYGNNSRHSFRPLPKNNFIRDSRKSKRSGR